jgi:hypothetical protein
MRKVQIALSTSILMLALLACNAVTRLTEAQTEIPAAMTAAPTMLAPLETAAAEITPPAMPTSAPDNNGTASTGGLGIALENVKNVMQATQQFTFTDGTVDGKPAVIASLSANAATTMPGLANGFSAAFIGDPADLSEIKITIPNIEDQAGVETGISMMTLLFAGILPPDVLLTFVPWLTENYSKVPVGGSEELTAKNLKFTLSKTQTETLLDIVPAK